MDEVLARINNDATAFLRSFTEKRNRNPKLAEDFCHRTAGVHRK